MVMEKLFYLENTSILDALLSLLDGYLPDGGSRPHVYICAAAASTKSRMEKSERLTRYVIFGEFDEILLIPSLYTFYSG